ncbi:MAG: S8 family peptidase [bacterium]
MSIFSFLKQSQNHMRKSNSACVNCESLEGRELLTAVAVKSPVARSGQLVRPLRPTGLKTPRLGKPQPTQTSAYANLKPAADAPRVFQDAASARANQGLDGTGMTVAFIDTGMNYNLDALGNGFGAGHKVIAGYDFGNSDGDPVPTWNHGSSTASIVGSTDPANPGIAPGANLVALKVFDDAGNSSFFKIADALEWVVANHDKYNITVVNISLSDSSNFTLNWFARDTSAGQRITDAVSRLRGLNIPVVSATGNSFKGTEGVGFTAIVQDTISVTGVDPSTNQIASNAQRLGAATAGGYATDLAAPSRGFKAVTGDKTYEWVDGTSFAAPVVSGSITLLQQKYFEQFGQLPTVDQIESWLKQSGDPTSDPITKLQIPQIDLAGALALVPEAPKKPVLPVVTLPVNTAPVTASPANPLQVSINGQAAATGTQAGRINLDNLQQGTRWKAVQIWTAEAMNRRSAASDGSVATTGTTQKATSAGAKTAPVARPSAAIRRTLPGHTQIVKNGRKTG